ncbi:RNA polymerase sigma factor, sigma-70 family [Streptomyces misionensis]|uniref:RNA polymerase sigma factor, sigma-70 family n=1 Tax=Streptomyces misionensis TaxID=67331 RepID=A0A1H4I5V5_9ACTN|nr:sigma-70 family RNA polymerase sigma factor [Streptomyces misionensis]SEB29457.1 RNA polymerase sigma factor, sigma-70 family [Streptomyces misionensis]
MSIVAERPVIPQVAGRADVGERADVAVSAGLAEEIERQEQEDDARGFEPEPEPQERVRVRDRSGERSRAERDRVRPAVTAGVPENALLTSSYTEPVRVSLRAVADEPLSAQDAVLVGELFALHAKRLVRYVWLRLDRFGDGPLAEDLAQEVWLGVSRPGGLELLREVEPQDAFGILAGRAKWMIARHFRLRSNRDERLVRVADGDDSADAALERTAHRAPAAVPAEPVAGELPAHWQEALELLEPKLREIVHLRFELAMSYRAIGARLELSQCAVTKRLKRAIAQLRPVASGGEVAVPVKSDPFPDGWETVVDVLPEVWRAIVRLRAEGLTNSQIAARVGRSPVTVSNVTAQSVRRLVEALRAAGRDAELPKRPAVSEPPEGWEAVADRLPELHRAVVALRAQGVPTAEVAARLGLKSDSYIRALWREGCARLHAAVQA